jgi:hypothetical protein
VRLIKNKSPNKQRLMGFNFYQGSPSDCLEAAYLYLGWESNPHFRRNWILNPARLPIPPPRQVDGKISKYFVFSDWFFERE